jgi:hypothetical protein
LSGKSALLNRGDGSLKQEETEKAKLFLHPTTMGETSRRRVVLSAPLGKRTDTSSIGENLIQDSDCCFMRLAASRDPKGPNYHVCENLVLQHWGKSRFAT